MASGKSQDSIRIRNLKQVQNALKELGVSNQELGRASFEAGSITARSIQAFMPRRTGKLASTVKASKLGTKVVVTIGNNTTATYAAPVNFGWLFVGPGHQKSPRAERSKTGTPNIKPRRFIEKALRTTRQRVLDTYIDELQKLVHKYERKANQ